MCHPKWERKKEKKVYCICNFDKTWGRQRTNLSQWRSVCCCMTQYTTCTALQVARNACQSQHFSWPVMHANLMFDAYWLPVHLQNLIVFSLKTSPFKNFIKIHLLYISKWSCKQTNWGEHKLLGISPKILEQAINTGTVTILCDDFHELCRVYLSQNQLYFYDKS